jgi:hypothetical protein
VPVVVRALLRPLDLLPRVLGLEVRMPLSRSASGQVVGRALVVRGHWLLSPSSSSSSRNSTLYYVLSASVAQMLAGTL